MAYSHVYFFIFMFILDRIAKDENKKKNTQIVDEWELSLPVLQD